MTLEEISTLAQKISNVTGVGGGQINKQLRAIQVAYNTVEKQYQMIIKFYPTAESVILDTFEFYNQKGCKDKFPDELDFIKSQND